MNSVNKYWHNNFPLLKDMVDLLYKYNPVGGCAHIVVDDENITDDNLNWVIDYCKEQSGNVDAFEKWLCEAICKMLLECTYEQRVLFFKWHNATWRETNILDKYVNSYESFCNSLFIGMSDEEIHSYVNDVVCDFDNI